MRHLTSLITSVRLAHLVLDSPSATFHSSLNVDRFPLNFSTMLPCVSFHSFINNSIGFERSRAWPRIQLRFSIIHSRLNTSQVPPRVDLRLMYLSSMLRFDSFICRIIAAKCSVNRTERASIFRMSSRFYLLLLIRPSILSSMPVLQRC